jgi:hypothetical protein
MDMKQMMACLLAEIRTNQAKIQNNREEMLARTETNREIMEPKQKNMTAEMDAN